MAPSRRAMQNQTEGGVLAALTGNEPPRSVNVKKSSAAAAALEEQSDEEVSVLSRNSASSDKDSSEEGSSEEEAEESENDNSDEDSSKQLDDEENEEEEDDDDDDESATSFFHGDPRTVDDNGSSSSISDFEEESDFDPEELAEEDDDDSVEDAEDADEIRAARRNKFVETKSKSKGKLLQSSNKKDSSSEIDKKIAASDENEKETTSDNDQERDDDEDVDDDDDDDELVVDDIDDEDELRFARQNNDHSPAKKSKSNRSDESSDDSSVGDDSVLEKCSKKASVDGGNTSVPLDGPTSAAVDEHSDELFGGGGGGTFDFGSDDDTDSVDQKLPGLPTSGDNSSVDNMVHEGIQDETTHKEALDLESGEVAGDEKSGSAATSSPKKGSASAPPVEQITTVAETTDVGAMSPLGTSMCRDSRLSRKRSAVDDVVVAIVVHDSDDDDSTEDGDVVVAEVLEDSDDDDDEETVEGNPVACSNCVSSPPACATPRATRPESTGNETVVKQSPDDQQSCGVTNRSSDPDQSVSCKPSSELDIPIDTEACVEGANECSSESHNVGDALLSQLSFLSLSSPEKAPTSAFQSIENTLSQPANDDTIVTNAPNEASSQFGLIDQALEESGIDAVQESSLAKGSLAEKLSTQVSIAPACAGENSICIASPSRVLAASTNNESTETGIDNLVAGMDGKSLSPISKTASNHSMEEEEIGEEDVMFTSSDPFSLDEEPNVGFRPEPDEEHQKVSNLMDNRPSSSPITFNTVATFPLDESNQDVGNAQRMQTVVSEQKNSKNQHAAEHLSADDDHPNVIEPRPVKVLLPTMIESATSLSCAATDLLGDVFDPPAFDVLVSESIGTFDKSIHKTMCDSQPQTDVGICGDREKGQIPTRAKSVKFLLPDTPSDSDAEVTDSEQDDSNPLAKTIIPQKPEAASVEKQPEAVRVSKLRREGSVKRGKWKLGSKIGAGAFGVVHIGMNTETGNLMAVKSLRMEPAVMKDAKLEVQLLKTLEHVNVVKYYGAEMDSKYLHIFQEWIPGGSITSLLAKFGPFPIAVLRSYLLQTITGLAYLHDRNIMHRDIKGSNILVNDEGVVKLADFGAGKRLGQWQSDMMLSMTMRGTPYFMAPEVFEEKYSSKADIWSIGCVAFQMATGSPPWKALGYTNPVSLFQHISEVDGPPAMDINEAETVCGFGEGRNMLELFKKVVASCFRRLPEERPTAQELLQHSLFSSKHSFVAEEIETSTLFSPLSARKKKNNPSSPFGTNMSPVRPRTRQRSNSLDHSRSPFSSPPLHRSASKRSSRPPLSPQPDTSDWPAWAREKLLSDTVEDVAPRTNSSSNNTGATSLDSLAYSVSPQRSSLGSSPLIGLAFVDSLPGSGDELKKSS